ncbi:MAG: hypothetical protein ACI38Q_08630 [Candidatus Bruticola sp.]
MIDHNRPDSEQLRREDQAYAEHFSENNIDDGSDRYSYNQEFTDSGDTVPPPIQKRSVYKIYSCVAAIVVCLGLLAAGLFYYFSLSSGNMDNVVLEVAGKAPRDCEALVAVDLRREDIFNKAFNVLLSSMDSNEALKQALEKIIPQEIGLTAFKELAEHADGAGAVIVRVGDMIAPQAPPLFVYIQEFKSDAPVEKIMQDLQKRAIKKNPNLKYHSVKQSDVTIHCPEKEVGLSWAIKGSELYLAPAGYMLEVVMKTIPEESMLTNSAFTGAIGQTNKDTLGFGFVDVERLLVNLHIEEAMEKNKMDREIVGIVSSLRNISFRGDIVQGPSGRCLKFSSQLNCNPELYGAYGKRIFNSANNVDFKTLKYHPAVNSSLSGLNLRVIWNMAYTMMSATEDTKQYRDLPNVFLGRVGCSMDKLFEILTGECCISIGGLGRISGKQLLNENYSPDAKAYLEEIQACPIVVTFGIKDIQGFKKLLNKIPQLAMGLTLLKSHKVGDYTAYELSSLSGPYFAIGPQCLVFAHNSGNLEQFKKMLMGQGSSWEKMSLIDQSIKNGKLSGLFISCEQAGINRMETAAALEERLSSAENNAELLKKTKDAFELMGRSLGYSIFRVYAQNDKISAEMTTEISDVSSSPIAKKDSSSSAKNTTSKNSK